MSESEPTWELLRCSYRCRLCNDVVTTAEGMVICQCGAIAVDLLDARQSLMRRRGDSADFISLCVWRNVITGEERHDGR